MKTKIISLNVGGPAALEWDGRTIKSSMLKHPVPGPLVVHPLHIEGDSFASPIVHGTPDSVLYAFGRPSARLFAARLGLPDYAPGSLGENLLLEDFDEDEVSVGDVFKIGEVKAQATFPRIPCGKVSFRMRHKEGQRALQQTGRSGVYFRILKPGLIALSDEVERMERATVRFTIAEVYRLQLENATSDWPQEAQARALANGAFPVVLRDLLKA